MGDFDVGVFAPWGNGRLGGADAFGVGGWDGGGVVFFLGRGTAVCDSSSDSQAWGGGGAAGFGLALEGGGAGCYAMGFGVRGMLGRGLLFTFPLIQPPPPPTQRASALGPPLRRPQKPPQLEWDAA